LGKSLKTFLAELATDPDALAKLLFGADGQMAEAGVDPSDQELVRKAKQPELLARLAADSSPSIQPPRHSGFASPTSPGSLVVVGTGIRCVGHLTIETIAQIKHAEKVFYLVMEPVAEEVIRGLSPAGAESLADLYREGKPRRETYQQMVERILASVRSGRRTCAVFYGHPGVFVGPAHEAIRPARADGFPAEMLAGVSAEDCLFSDLGVDPASDGCQSYEATDFLVNGRLIDASSHVVLWQVGVLGDRTFSYTVSDVKAMEFLTNRLAETHPLDHKVCVYEASILPLCKANIRWCQLGQLPKTQMSIISTLYIPPARPPRFDTALYFALTWPVASGESRRGK
jgi:uncharacterized protein YabN with tetrapyrrole methylase and pyrophosphatase domain